MKPPLPEMTEYERIVIKQLANHFVVDGERFGEIITEGQMHIFGSIIFRHYKRVQIICPTQYGKSLTVALACIILSAIEGRKVAIVAPSGEKAKIIMRYFADFLQILCLYSSFDFSHFVPCSGLRRVRR